MVDRSTVSTKLKDAKLYGWGIYENVVFTTNDYFTATDFASTVALKQAFLVKNSDGSELTTTISYNVVTVTGTCSNDLCTLFLFGVRI
jgi:hypothetical protein